MAPVAIAAQLPDVRQVVVRVRHSRVSGDRGGVSNEGVVGVAGVLQFKAAVVRFGGLCGILGKNADGERKKDQAEGRENFIM